MLSWVEQEKRFIISGPGLTQQTHNVSRTSLQRRCNVTTLQRRLNDVIETLCDVVATL